MKRGPKPRYIVATETIVLRDPQDDQMNRYVQIDDEGDFWISDAHPGNPDVFQILIRHGAQMEAFLKLLKKAQAS
jgi:hypothetical protein